VPVVAPGPDKAVGREQAAGAAEGGSSVSPLEALGGDAAEVGGAAGPSGGAAAMAVGTAPKPLTVTLGSAAQAQGAGRATTPPQHSPVLSQSAPPAAAPFAAYEAAAGAATPRSTAIAGMHPIWNQADEVAQVLGFVGVGDIIASFVKQLDETLDLKLATHPRLPMLHLMKSLEKAGRVFGSTAIRELVDGYNADVGLFTQGDGDFLISSQLGDLKVLDVIRQGFLKGEPGAPSLRAFTTQAPSVHRLVVVDVHAGPHATPAGKLDNVFSQTDVIRYLCGDNQIVEEGPETHDTISDTLREALSNVLVGDLPGWNAGANDSVGAACVPASTLAIQAVHEMLSKGLRALGVVDGKGRLIGNFSVADLRGIRPEHLGALALPVAELIAWEHQTEYSGYAANRTEHPFASSRADRVPGAEVGQSLKVCTLKSTLLAVLRNLAKNKLHRLWVVDDAGKPLGVISCTDIMNLIAGE
jgi:CBS domain-containing protein